MSAKKKKKSDKKTNKKSGKKTKLKVIRSADYRGSKIEVVAKKAAQKVQVDGKQIATSRDADTGAYVCTDAPYVHYGSLEEVAQAVIDAKKEG